MSEIADVKEEMLPIIEVPPELRGLSDEEIIKRSEKELREVSGKRKKGERRPGKRERIAAKERKSHEEAAALFRSSVETLPPQKSEIFRNAFTEKSPSCTKIEPEQRHPGTTNFLMTAKKTSPSGNEKSATTKTFLGQTPSSGRVLKASFGAKVGEKPKAVIVSAAELALQKAEERAKKIREALFAKRTTASAIQTDGPAAQPEGQPVKRPRGRPRKNPLPEA